MNTRKLIVLPILALLLPFDLVVAFCLLVASGLAVVYNRRLFVERKEKKRRTATIQILNWDGKHLLEECLPSVLDAVRAAGGDHRVLVVDNGSTDGSVPFLREHFPEVQILPLDRNYGFVEGNNRGVQTLDTDLVILLNNDMIVEQGFLAPLLAGFDDSDVFAVSSQIFLEDRSKRRVETGKTRGDFEKGFFRVWHDEITIADETRSSMPVFWAGGGSCAVDLELYRRVGGLDDLYHPFYVEDTDLSYQAWKRGWKCLLAPASHVVHKHRSTSSRKFSHAFVDNTIRRNLYLFIWKNVTDLPMVFEHILNLPRIHGAAMMRGEVFFEVRAFVRAVLRLPRALSRRLNNLPHYRMSDSEVLSRSRQ